MFKTNKKSVSLGLVVIGAFALLSTVLSVNLNHEDVEELSEVENENAKSSFDLVDPFSVLDKERVGLGMAVFGCQLEHPGLIYDTLYFQLMDFLVRILKT